MGPSHRNWAKRLDRPDQLRRELVAKVLAIACVHLHSGARERSQLDRRVVGLERPNQLGSLPEQ